MKMEGDNLQDNDFERKFGGLRRLYGARGFERIARAHIVIVGVGGVGSWTAEALARSGVRRLTLIDMDHVSVSNINRQIHASDATLGAAKVQAIRERIASFHPTCIVDVVEDFVDEANWPALLHTLPNTPKLPEKAPMTCPGSVPIAAVDAVIDACDDRRAKRTLATWAMHIRRTHAKAAPLFITAGAAGGKRQAHLVDIADLSATTHDPMLTRLRADLRRHAGAPRGGAPIGVSCVFSREEIKKPQQNQNHDGSAPLCDHSLNCHGYGSVVSVTATFGLAMAGWVLNHIAQD